MKLIYCPTQLSEAANFLAEKNLLKHKCAGDWLQEIYDCMVTGAKEGKYSIIGTGGYYISFSGKDGAQVEVDVLVDPAVGIDSLYLEIEI